MDNDGAGAPGPAGDGGAAEYDYNALLAKVDTTIEVSHATATAPVVIDRLPQQEFHTMPSLVRYIKANHSFVRLYRTNYGSINLPQSIFVLVFSVFFQLFLCIEFIRAGLDMGGTWILSILVWQPVLVLVTWGISVKSIPYCWPFVCVGGVLALTIWDLARGVSYDGASTAIAAFLFVFISNFTVEFVSLAVRYYGCYRACAASHAPTETEQAGYRSAPDVERRVGHLESARAVMQPAGGPQGSAGGFVPPPMTTVSAPAQPSQAGAE